MTESIFCRRESRWRATITDSAGAVSDWNVCPDHADSIRWQSAPDLVALIALPYSPVNRGCQWAAYKAARGEAPPANASGDRPPAAE